MIDPAGLLKEFGSFLNNVGYFYKLLIEKEK